MANNLLNGLSLTAIAAETLPVLQKATPIFGLISSDFSADVAQVGSAVSSRIPTAASAVAYSRANGYVEQTASSSAATVTFDKHYHVTFGFDDSEVGNIGLAKLQSTFIEPAIYGLVNQAQSDLYALIGSGGFPSAYSASYASFGFGGITTCAKVLDNSGSTAPRALFADANLYYDILDDLKSVSVVGADTLIRQGNIGDIAGIKVAMAPSLTSGTYRGFMAGKDALVMAARVPAIAGSTNVEVVNVTDPASQFTVQLRKWYSSDKGMHMLSAVAIYGVAVGNKFSGVRVLCTD